MSGSRPTGPRRRRQALETKVRILARAIRERRPVAGFGRGLRREFCPHVFGLKGERAHAFVWQFGGESEGGLAPGDQHWRCFDLDDLDGLAVQDGPWHRGWFAGRQEQSCIDQILLEVDPVFGPKIRR